MANKILCFQFYQKTSNVICILKKNLLLHLYMILKCMCVKLFAMLMRMNLRWHSFQPKLLECFDWNTNVKESMKNLLKCPTRIYSEFEQIFQWAILHPKWSCRKKDMMVWLSCSLTPKIPCTFFTEPCSFWHTWKNQFFKKIKVWEFKELTVGSWSYLVENQPQNISTPHSMVSKRL
jgi:hypothetical protein